jgi:hypothetical protein
VVTHLTWGGWVGHMDSVEMNPPKTGCILSSVAGSSDVPTSVSIAR